MVKQVLRLGIELHQPKWEELAANTRAVIFLGTPHQGSGLVTLAKAAKVFGFSTATLQLSANDPHLLALNEWYQQNAVPYGFKTHAYYETQPCGPALVVDQGSANPGVQGCVPIAFDGNHFDICKPSSRQSPIYLGVLSILQAIVTTDASAQAIKEVKIDKGDLADEHLSAHVEDYNFFTKKIDEEERMDLEEKLRRGGREIEIPRAVQLKEQFAKRLNRNALQSAATRRYIKILSEVAVPL